MQPGFVVATSARVSCEGGHHAVAPVVCNTGVGLACKVVVCAAGIAGKENADGANARRRSRLHEGWPVRPPRSLHCPRSRRPNEGERRVHPYDGIKDDQQYVRILLHVTDIDALIHMGLLKDDQRADADALQAAVLGLVYRAT
jgi:hypothetical protein